MVCRMAVASLKIVRSGDFPFAALPGWVSSLFIYAGGVRFRGCHHALDRSAGLREQWTCSVYHSISDRCCIPCLHFILLVWSHRRVWKGLLWRDRRINLAAYSQDDWSLICICSGWLVGKLDLLCKAVFCCFEEVPWHRTPLWAILSEYSWFSFDHQENRC